MESSFSSIFKQWVSNLLLIATAVASTGARFATPFLVHFSHWINVCLLVIIQEFSISKNWGQKKPLKFADCWFLKCLRMLQLIVNCAPHSPHWKAPTVLFILFWCWILRLFFTKIWVLSIVQQVNMIIDPKIYFERVFLIMKTKCKRFL